ncbi:hypothetical protein B0H14DRAFT_3487419 [Mycena olivaceomarginata]|nr:hypothetical protein B0H14DRAFT_3487419 [Mycena olivaceomarginata]
MSPHPDMHGYPWRPSHPAPPANTRPSIAPIPSRCAPRHVRPSRPYSKTGMCWHNRITHTHLGTTFAILDILHPSINEFNADTRAHPSRASWTTMSVGREHIFGAASCNWVGWRDGERVGKRAQGLADAGTGGASGGSKPPLGAPSGGIWRRACTGNLCFGCVAEQGASGRASAQRTHAWPSGCWYRRSEWCAGAPKRGDFGASVGGEPVFWAGGGAGSGRVEKRAAHAWPSGRWTRWSVRRICAAHAVV